MRPWHVVAIALGLAFVAFVAFGVFGCSAHPDDDPRELVAIEQPLISDDNFGYRLSTYGACNPGVNDTCYYPPFHDHPWNICLDSSGMTFNQALKTSNAITTVKNAMVAHGVTMAFTKVGGCSSMQPIHVVKAALADVGFPDDLRNFTRISCTNSLNLNESPPLPGVHRKCFAVTITLDLDKLDTRFNGIQNQYDHVVGSMAGLASIGASLTNDAAHATRWSYSLVTGPANKFDFGSVAYCRHDAADWAAPDPLFIQKQDNGCD